MNKRFLKVMFPFQAVKTANVANLAQLVMSAIKKLDSATVNLD